MNIMVTMRRFFLLHSIRMQRRLHLYDDTSGWDLQLSYPPLPHQNHFRCNRMIFGHDNDDDYVKDDEFDDGADNYYQDDNDHATFGRGPLQQPA